MRPPTTHVEAVAGTVNLNSADASLHATCRSLEPLERLLQNVELSELLVNDAGSCASATLSHKTKVQLLKSPPRTTVIGR